MGPTASRRAAIGLSPHIGWAAIVVVSGPPEEEPTLVAKRRVEMARTFETGAVYHASQRLPAADAERLVRSSEQAFEAVAEATIAALVEELRSLGVEPTASVILAGRAKPLPPLEAILRSHALVHAAEGELYRNVLARASEACTIRATFVPALGLAERVARAAGISESRVASSLASMGRASGKPWAKDQKAAALAAWLSLARRADGYRKVRRT